MLGGFWWEAKLVLVTHGLVQPGKWLQEGQDGAHGRESCGWGTGRGVSSSHQVARPPCSWVLSGKHRCWRRQPENPDPQNTHVRAHTHTLSLSFSLSLSLSLSHSFLLLDLGRADVFVNAPHLWNGFDEVKGLQPLASDPFCLMESCSPTSCVEQTKVV